MNSQLTNQLQQQKSRLIEQIQNIYQMLEQVQHRGVVPHTFDNPELLYKINKLFSEAFIDKVSHINYNTQLEPIPGFKYHLVAGPISAGKSSLISKACDIELPTGVGQTTTDINFVTITEKNVYIIDSPGINQKFAYYDTKTLSLFNSADFIFYCFCDSLKNSIEVLKIIQKLRPRKFCGQGHKQIGLMKMTQNQQMRSWKLIVKFYQNTKFKLNYIAYRQSGVRDFETIGKFLTNLREILTESLFLQYCHFNQNFYKNDHLRRINSANQICAILIHKVKLNLNLNFLAPKTSIIQPQMRKKNQKDEQKEIRRLKEILFPKNKQTYKNALNLMSSTDILQSQTRRQLTLNSQDHQFLGQRPKSKQNLINHKIKIKMTRFDKLYVNQECDQINELESYEVGSAQSFQKEPGIAIKEEISRLKQQISTMLKKCSEDDDECQRQESFNESEQKTRSQLLTYQAINQKFQQSSGREAHTRRHYLSNINKLTQHLQKYNSYMYGIKQAAEQVLSSIPVIKNQQKFTNPHLKAYKLYYLGMLLTNYFVAQIQNSRVKRLSWAFNRVFKTSEKKKHQFEQQNKTRSINKGKFMFLRKNLIGKAFQKWRLNSQLIKFHEALNPPIQASLSQEKSYNLHQSMISDKSTNSQNKNGQLLISEFLLKNILHKQKVVQFLREYLLNSINVSTARLVEKQALNHLKNDVEIVLLDTQNNEMFSFLNQTDYLYQEMEGRIVESRLQNILDTIRTDSNVYQQNYSNEVPKKCFKKYCFQLKNSLTRMCIDCEKTIRIPEMKRNQVYSLEVDSSINEQILIKTQKTQRSSRVQEIQDKKPLSMAEHNKAMFMTQEVFYSHKSMLDNYFSYLNHPATKVSAIFYPIIHEDSLIGLVRQYIYHSVPISLQHFQIPYEDLDFVTKSIFTAFELSYSFQGLRKEYDIVERKYALKVLKLIKKIQGQIEDITQDKQFQAKTQDDLTQRIMQIFTDEMSCLLDYQKIKTPMISQSQKSQNRMGLLVYKIKKEQDKTDKLIRNEKILLCFEEKEEKQRFNQLFGSMDVDETEIEGILNEFYNESRHKESHISVVRNLFNRQQQMKQGNKIDQMGIIESKRQKSQTIMVIKSKQSIDCEALYCMLVFNQINYQKLMQNLPPLQLLVDIMNKFSQVYQLGLKQLSESKQIKQINYMNKMIRNKNKMTEKMSQFYLEQIKMHVYDRKVNELKKERIRPYSTYINVFVKKCMNKLVDELKCLQIATSLREGDRMVCEIKYSTEINFNIPKGPLEQRQMQSQKFFIVLTELISKEINTPSLCSKQDTKKSSTQSIKKFQLFNEKQYFMWLESLQINQGQSHQSDNLNKLISGKQGQTSLTFKVVTTTLKVQSSEQNLTSSLIPSTETSPPQHQQFIFTKQQAAKTLQQLIQSFISFTFSQVIQDQSSKIIQSQQSSSLAQIPNQLKDQYLKDIQNFKQNIKDKLFLIYCKSRNESIQNFQSTDNHDLKPNICQNLQDFTEILHHVAKIVCRQHSLLPQSIQIQVNFDVIKLFFQEIASFKQKNTIPCINIKTQHHKLIPLALFSTYQTLLQLIDCSEIHPSTQRKATQSSDHQDNFLLFYLIIQKSEILRSQLNLLTKNNLINSYQNHSDNELNLLNTQTSSASNFFSKQNPTLPIKQLNQAILSSYFVVNTQYQKSFNVQEKHQLITIKVNKSLQSLTSQSKIQQIYRQLTDSLSVLVQSAMVEYISLYNWKENKYLMNRLIQAFGILVYGDSKLRSQKLQKLSEPIEKNRFVRNSQGLLMENLYFAFDQIKKYTSHLIFKGSQLIRLSKLISNNSKQSALKHLLKWQSFKNEVKHGQFMTILKNKIISNPEKQSQKTQFIVNTIGKTLVYPKILWHSFTKINFFAKHSRIADFTSFRLKYLHNALQLLNKASIRVSSQLLKKFFQNCAKISFCKRREQLFRLQSMKLFVVQLANTSVYKGKIMNNVKKAFNVMKQLSKINKQLTKVQTQDNTSSERQRSVDEQVTQSKSIEQVSSILSKYFCNYDIWTRPLKKSHDYMLIAKSKIQTTNQDLIISVRNLSFDESSIMASRINSTTNDQQLTLNSRLTKEDIYLRYSPDQYSLLETSQTIFVSRNSFNVHDLLASDTLQLGQSINSSNFTNSFKHKDKLHSLSKSLVQFFSNFKIQFNIKITYLDSVFSILKLKRFSYSLKKWKKYNDNLRLLATCELTDKIYQLNVQSESIKDKLKIQQKEIHDQKSEYNRLLKKENEHKNRIEKYSINIEILGKMLGHYQMTKKQEEQQAMKSAAKSSKKYNKNKYLEPLIDLNSLDQEQRSMVVMTLTKWRKVNESDKLKELRLRNAQKQTKFMFSCMSRCWKIMSRTVKLSSFQNILSYSIYAEELRQNKLREERTNQQRLNRQEQERREKQRVEREIYEKKRKQIEQLRREIEERKLKQAIKDSWKYETQHLSGSKNITPNKFIPSTIIQPIKDVSEIQSYRHDDSHTQSYNEYSMESVEKRSISHSLAEQLEGEFNQLNRRLVTFQKNNASPNSQSEEITYDNCFESFETQQRNSPPQQSEHELSQRGLQEYKAPNNTVELTALVPQKINEVKMTEEDKIRFELEKMKMKKPQFNKENLTVTKEEYEKVNGGASYKLGGKTLRFLKRMGKLEGGEKLQK